jgi:hypothetical protein
MRPIRAIPSSGVAWMERSGIREFQGPGLPPGYESNGYRKVNGKWLISREHVSVPADLATGKAKLTSKPSWRKRGKLCQWNMGAGRI